MKCVCIVCRVNTNHSVVHNLPVPPDPILYTEVAMQIVECAGCEAKSFRLVATGPINGLKEDGNGYLEKEYLFPRRHMLRRPIDIHCLPADLRTVYLEVLNALQNEIYILSAAGIRAIVEGVCIHKNAPHRNLYKNITWLGEQGIITSEHADALHAQRILGNEAVHELSQPTEQEFHAAMDIIENVLTGIYVLPKTKERQEREAQRRKNGK